MEISRAEKRLISDDCEVKMLEPILVRLDKKGCAPHDIHIDKSEFKIGRARDNDEIILDTMISRRHCILRCEGNEEWIIKDLSSSSTSVNGVPLKTGVSQRLSVGDTIQFSTSNEFKYVFTLNNKEERSIKKPRLDEEIFDNVLTEQKTFAENQESQRKVVKDRLQIKQKEQVALKQQLEQLLTQQSIARDDKEGLERQILTLQDEISRGSAQEKHLQNIYAELLDRLEQERVRFEDKLNKERQRWQEALDMSKQEKEQLERRTKEQMEKWREEQQTEWKTVMENRVKEEKDIQAQLLNEKTILEEKLKETERALKEQEAKAETVQQQNEGVTIGETGESCILFEILDETSGIHILDTIDLTVPSQAVAEQNVNEGVLNKVTDIMDEQLTCSVCQELFIKATTLSCTHTFCHDCIVNWTKRSKDCPVCRASVRSMNRSLVLDNFIESMMENLPSTVKEKRQEVIKERKKALKKNKGEETRKRKR